MFLLGPWAVAATKFAGLTALDLDVANVPTTCLFGHQWLVAFACDSVQKSTEGFEDSAQILSA